MVTWQNSTITKTDDALMITTALILYEVIPFLTSSILLKLFNLQLNRPSYHQITFVVCYTVITWCLTVTIAYIIKAIYRHYTLTPTDKNIICIQLLIFMLFSLIFSEILRNFSLLGKFQLFMLFVLISQFTFSTLLTYVFIRKNRERTELWHLQEQMKMMMIYTKEIEANYRKLRKFRHDYKNLLLGLQTTSKTLNQAYLNEVIDYSHHILDNSFSSFAQASNIKRDAIKAIIIAKLLLAKQQGLTPHFECLQPISDFNLADVKLVRILGILIDNAIEAAISSTDKKLRILFINAQTYEIIIENSYSGKLPPLNLMRQEGYSKKNQHQGLGLNTVNEIVRASPHLELTHYIEDGIFGTSLIISKEELQ